MNRPVFRALYRCAGVSYPSHPTSPVHRSHGSEAYSANEPPQAGIGRALVSACCARRKESPNPSYSGWSARAQELRARDSRHRAASAGLFASAGESASRGTLRAVRMGCACSARLQRLPATWNSATPQWRMRAVPSAPRAIRSRLQPTQMLQAAMGRPTMAARQLAAVAQPLQGPVASARPCAPLRMRSITTGVSHLYRADPSSGHQAPMLLCNAGGCDDGSATRCTCSRALSSLADLDPKARSALRIRKEGKSIASTGRPGPNRRTCAFCPSV